MAKAWRLIKGLVGPRHNYREKHRNPTKCVAFEIKENTGNISECRRKKTHFKSFFFPVTILLFSARSGGEGLTTPLRLLFLFTALQERCTLALDINLFLLPVGSIFVELQETDSDLDDDLDRLDPDTEHQDNQWNGCSRVVPLELSTALMFGPQREKGK